MTNTTIHRLNPVVLLVSALAGCGTDPYIGDVSSPQDADTSTQTTTLTNPDTAQPTDIGTNAQTGTDTSLQTTTTTTTDTSVVVPDAGVGGPDSPVVANPVIETTTYLTVAPTRLLDLVFMIDNSPSMAPKVAKLNAQFPKLIAALKDPADSTLPDLHVAIIDSDLGTANAYSSGSCGPRTLRDGTVSSYGDLGRFQMIDSTICGVNSADSLWLEYKNGPLNYTGDINSVFTCLAGNLGTLGCGVEHQLQAFEFALAARGIGNDEQQKMLRANAYLGLVILSDEDDCSAATNDGMFGDMTELRGESASLRCATRAHKCNGKNLADSPPGYPTDSEFSADFASCTARTDACPNETDDGPGHMTDTSLPTACSPLKDFKVIADEMKALKPNWQDQLLVAGIFGWPRSDSDMATAKYEIKKIPNPNTADTTHPEIYDYMPVCYDPDHMPKSSAYDRDAAGWGAQGGLRLSAYIDEFGDNGMKFSICERDFTNSMKIIGSKVSRKIQNRCLQYKLFDADTNATGVQPDCRVVYRTPIPDPKDPAKIVYMESAESLPQCPVGATTKNITADCWQLSDNTALCPDFGKEINVLRPQAEIDMGPLTPGTKIAMSCRSCVYSGSEPGCNY
jgi:hypothetical protein